MKSVIKKLNRVISSALSFVMTAMLILPHISFLEVQAAERKYNLGDTILAFTSEWHHYCIDGYEVVGAAGGLLENNDLYQYVYPSTQLSKRDRNILFWATLSMLANNGTNPELAKIYNSINDHAPAAGLPQLIPDVTEADLKSIIHKQSTLNDYPWINAAMNNAEAYMKLGGIISSASSTTLGGKTIPVVLQGHNTLSDALQVDSGSFTIQFDSDGVDKDFINTVPIEFSPDGSDDSWGATPIGGWTYQKADTSIIFSNSNPSPPQLLIRFNTKNTVYEGAGGNFTSVEEAYEKGLQLWICIECCGQHKTSSGRSPALSNHQRTVWMEMKSDFSPYYAVIGTDPVPSLDEGGIQFKVYRHAEDMTSTYNVQMYKYDHETGKPLEDSIFKLYERFDDKEEINQSRDGHVEIYEGGTPYQSYHTDNPVTWEDFRYVSSLSTNEDGHAAKTINHGYHYDKTFCDGHPAPQFVSVPDEENDEEGELENEDEIEAAQAENQKLAGAWLDCAASCSAHASGAFAGVHFHWIQSGVSQSTIESIRSSGGSPGTSPNAGPTTSAAPETSFQSSGCEDDRDQTYDKFISLKYSYALIEYTAREGYIRHDLHGDDLPIEVITTDASENGANASFANEYSKDIMLRDSVIKKSISEIKFLRSVSSVFQLETTEREPEEKVSLVQTVGSYAQEIVAFFIPEEASKATDSNAATNAGEDLIDDVNGSGTATPSNIRKVRYTRASTATASNVRLKSQVVFSSSDGGTFLTATSDDDDDSGSISASSTLFTSAYNSALNGASSGKDATPGPDDHYSHCNNTDREGNAWRIYDHRTEGEIHINKRDMELLAGETPDYSSSGDTQGDGTLEGAVYGLYAAADIIHPDGKTGTVYQANNLVAIATTDKEGNASFIAFTEAPGQYYNYETGLIEKTSDGWHGSAPKNLYVADTTYDDYTVDGRYEREYYNNQANNGNCWIGRPLILGDYYVKELTRSEGYELSIGNKEHGITNNGQNYNVTIPEGTGYANITRKLYSEGQIREGATGAYGDPGHNELFLTAESRETGTNGFDIVLNNLPAGAKFYRLDTGRADKQIETGTGEYDLIYLTDSNGNPVYAVAENDYQYPKYNADGSLMTREVSTNYQASQFLAATIKTLNADLTKEAIESEEPAMTAADVALKLAADFDRSDFSFLKGKAEKALRKNGKTTPFTASGGSREYSGIYAGVFDAGVREGETDTYGVSGVAPGQPADKTVYGSPVITLELPKADESGTPVTMGDVILSVLDFYNTNSFYNYCGVDSIEDDGTDYLITVYASSYGNPKDFMVLGSDEEDDSIIFHRAEYLPDDPAKCPRYVYVTYSNNSSYDAFGTYEDFRSQSIGGRYFASATLITDAVIEGDGTIITRKVTENVCYQTGESPYDGDGNRIRAFKYVERTATITQNVEVNEWIELPVMEADGKYVVPINSSYTDFYGTGHSDGDLQSYTFRIVVPEKEVTLTQADLDAMYDSTGWSAGDTMGGAEYYLRVYDISVKAYLNYADMNITGANSCVQPVTLAYPGDTYIWQDGESKPGTNTRLNPVAVQERMIKQQIKVTKDIDPKSYENTDSYSEVHEDWFTRTFGRLFGKDTAATKMDNFRFKTYLKSNLQRLYRNQDGNVIWQDRKGNEINVLVENQQYPELVNKIFTRVLHGTDPLYQDSGDAIISNEVLYSYTGGFINEDQNAGYTAVLETVEQLAESGVGTRIVKGYNYEKFFDAIAAANNDKWDDANPTYTSWQPIGNQANRTGNTLENAKASDMVRQFAIDWYLDDEIAKLIKAVPNNATENEDKDGVVPYSDEMYDEALRNAIKKAENYLKPFFVYDLDEIYAIEWDSENGGGSDGDNTTLSADTNFGDDSGYYFGTSLYLPYGTYVVVEQQPRYADLEDFKNKHYETDKPREVELPSVYASYADSQSRPEVRNPYYNYNADMAQGEMERKFRIRFNEESHVIKGHNHYGDFEVYKYGQDIDRITNGVPRAAGSGDYFALTQSEYKPYKNYYNEQDDRNSGHVPYYLTEGQSGRNEVSKYYRYSSVSEDAGTANDVPFPEGTFTEDNVNGTVYHDQVKTMHGVQTAYDGRYASMLVPYTIVAPASTSSEEVESTPAANGESSYSGYAYNKFRNRFYTSKLRIEKLDSETHENLLHDGALFNIYAAKRDDSKNGDGSVLFYSKDTTITGTKEFLAAMGAAGIEARKASWIDRITGKSMAGIYTGTIAAGTPICEESEQIILGDSYGNQTVAFKTYSTVLDGIMKNEANNTTLNYQLQTVGYLETPQPLGAGVYVICEMKAPAGYVRSKPIAVEVYSDKVTYYKEAEKDNRVLAAMYDYSADNPTTNGNKPQDLVHVARINVENTPIKLTVEKVKESSQNSADTTADKTVTYKVSGRVDGPLVEIGNDETLVYAYNENGEYLGYAWKKGTLENLAARRAAGEQIEIAYEGSIFAGYGFVTRSLETADDTNKYVVGATMTLFDALALTAAGDTEDHKYEGLVIERTKSNNITRMYVKQGYAGEKVEFVKERDENGDEYEITYEAGVDKNQEPLYAAGNIWKAETIQRPDTDILYYDLDSLDIFKTRTISGSNVTYGYDKNHDEVPLSMIESDKANHTKTDTEYSIFAFKGGIPYLEFVGGDFTRIQYSRTNKILEVGAGTVIYHLDRDGNRDALVDPYTGMAYIVEILPDGSEKILVWAVNIHKDAYGNIIARDKITTSRIATVGENRDHYSDSGTVEVTNHSGHEITDKPAYEHTESGYITGTWKSDAGEESHKETSVDTNANGHSMNDSVLTDDNNGSFAKELNPVYDEHGLPNYYQRSNETYDKGTDLYDRNDDFVRYQDSDNLEEYNHAAYRLNEHEELYDGKETAEGQSQKKLYHRLGESYILENTWVTSDKTPNNPFDTTATDGQADILKRLPAGTYIMEELIAPAGYLKGIPTGITVNETAAMHQAKMIDRTTKLEISKIDGTDRRIFDLVNMETGETEGTAEESKGAYGYGQVSDAVIALYEARKVYTSDFLTYPDGYYLVRKNNTSGPVTYYSTESMASSIKELTAKWTTGAAPLYLEGIPEGYYLLEELSAPSGFATSDPVPVHITNTAGVQMVVMADDHTKLEIAKHVITDDGTGKVILPEAGFTLYAGNTDGTYNPADIVDTWISNDTTDYTDSINLKDYPNTSGANKVSGFMAEFEKLYQEYGTTSGTSLSWAVERKAARSSTDDNVWFMEDGTRIPVINGVITYPAGMAQEDMDGFLSAYDANTKQADVIRWAANRSAAYISHTQIDSSTVNGNASTTKFPTTATMLFRTTEGNDIRITVYQKSQAAAGSDYVFEYQFDYRKLDSINNYACSYLTATGHRRYDYLPAGSTYVLVETSVPEGYARAANKVITIQDMAEIQYYTILNEKTAIRISKVAETSTGELAGTKMGLYKAAADSSLIQNPEYLMATWITGEDGIYTDMDLVNGLIPAGYKKGDLKPHTIRGLEDGTYYVVELAAPPYYTIAEPIRINYAGADEIRIVRVTNQVAKGQLIIHKADSSGAALPGVTFEVKAYRKATGEVVLERLVSDVGGTVLVSHLPTGDIAPDGTVTPYIYKVKEVTPPDGYAINPVIQTFSFEPDRQGVSYAYGDFAAEKYTVINEKTRIAIEKRSFEDLLNQNSGIEGAFMEGAELAVYEVLGRDGEGNVIYDDQMPADAWTTTAAEPKHYVDGLIASRSYVLAETQAPSGYTVMKPILFTVSATGRGISTVTNNINTITVNYISAAHEYLDTDNLDMDSIESLTVSGRYIIKNETVVLDDTGAEVTRWVAADRQHILYRGGGLQEGGIYTFAQYVRYSDGSSEVTNKETKRVLFDEQDRLIVTQTLTEHTTLSLYHADGTLIGKYDPGEFVPDQTFKNNVNPENPKIVMRNRGSGIGDPLDPAQAVINTVAYTNTANIRTDVTVVARIGSGVTILEAADGGVITGKTITWTIRDVAPYTSGYVAFNTEIAGTPESIMVTATVKYNQKILVSTREMPVLQPGRLTVFNELTGAGKRLYGEETGNFTVRLYSASGEELKGAYQYNGSRTGSLRSGDAVVLAGNQYIHIDPGSFYPNATYQVSLVPDGSTKQLTSRNLTGTITTGGAFALFTRAVTDTSERELFVKGGSYHLIESTTYADGRVKEISKIQFTLNDQAAIDSIGAYDKKTHVVISKKEITGGEELPGNHMKVIDEETGRTVEEWISGDQPHELDGVLEPGKWYILEEEQPADGYAYAEDIRFQVSADGTVDMVEMRNKPNTEHIYKYATASDGAPDFERPGNQAGAVLQILDKNKQPVKAIRSDGLFTAGEDLIFTTTDDFTMISKQLVVDTTYYLHEITPPVGLAYSADVMFTISHYGEIDDVIVWDIPTVVMISKQDITGEKELPGGHYSIHEDDNGTHGKTIHEYDGNEDGSPQIVTGILEAGKAYWLVEELSPTGYAYTEAVKFTVDRDGNTTDVVMKDKPTHVEIRKESENGELLGGAVLELYDETGVLVETMVTAAGSVWQLVAKLEAGKSYTLHEASAPAGYATAEDMTFTVSRDGVADEIKMVDHKVKGKDSPGSVKTPIEVPGNQITVGFITAEYTPMAAGVKKDIIGRIPLGRLVAMGDAARTGGLPLLALSSLWGMGIVTLSNKRKKSRKKKRKDS